MSQEEKAFTEIVAQLFKRVYALESQVYELMVTTSQDRQFFSAEQIDEITRRVDQNLTRTLREVHVQMEKEKHD